MNNSKSTKEVSKSNPLEVLTSIDNNVDLGTNKGISNLADKGTINVSSSNTPIGEKIDKIERQICKGKLRFMDDNGNPLVPMGSDKGYGTNILLEQWRDFYPDNDDYGPYDDDMYENHYMSKHLQSICDDLDITGVGMKNLTKGIVSSAALACYLHDHSQSFVVVLSPQYLAHHSIVGTSVRRAYIVEPDVERTGETLGGRSLMETVVAAFIEDHSF
ncbi:hypothetical protein Tco_0678437 [Tanacetum coccineum]|uniref:Uncharacterized protein n=1 Tax=Tanacetum coccineum TaxID=301880 RepID=A0ABQ4XFZ4_9ASTR